MSWFDIILLKNLKECVDRFCVEKCIRVVFDEIVGKSILTNRIYYKMAEFETQLHDARNI